jgi:hypothetical protein
MGNRLLLLLGAPLVMLWSGCGGGGGDADPWLGNWMRTGTQSTTCGLQTGTNQLTGLVVVTAGPSGTIKTTADGCDTLWDVSGNKATLRPGQMCTVTINGFNVTVTGTQGTVTLNGNIATGTEAGSANNGCSWNQQLTLTRM